jgi:hypothetical protein
VGQEAQELGDAVMRLSPGASPSPGPPQDGRREKKNDAIPKSFDIFPRFCALLSEWISVDSEQNLAKQVLKR